MFEALNKLIDRLEKVAMVAFMSIATIITTFQVVYRYGFNSSLSWAEEVVIYSIVCMSFVGASMGVRHGVHISVDVLNAFAPPAVNRWLHILTAVLGIAFAIALAYLGFRLFFSTLDRGMLSPAMRMPMAWVYFPIGLSGVLLIIRYCWVIHEVWHKPPVTMAEELAAEKDKLV
ncbi:putative TRAP transporter small permease protein [Vreelandella aquamarina]|jgi:C4-dicarboxylate transporter DctQ subunit|uniref:TRAP transporter small permease protein n=1 Tax=Vreelandella aquamarina TaxID=77097 RepID=A0A1N6CZK8_9GAMM|nr:MULTISPECIES: TRAP transporter small permease [Halomonas]HAO02110.1 TRAP transporter small permease [Halomonas sp.]MCO7244418.1 TRAP transporter small permease [Halomonas sp. Ps84H-12]SIN63917.1 C4-dicarboxylate transporter, DctQ subunit [Halomonas meridiana]SIN72843.1 C4-dicarboxylate transporter, DctQ subunit [Halomonas meridiana]SIO41500.1 C4-dicarboxylate transporter, DctQ subunit [Halomonas meridiana]